MTVYSVCMFAAAAVFFGIAAAVYRGNINLIHSYHRTHLEEADRKDYGRSFAKGLFTLAVSQIFSGIAALFGKTAPIAVISIGILFVGMVLSFIIIARVQKKFNGGFY